MRNSSRSRSRYDDDDDDYDRPRRRTSRRDDDDDPPPVRRKSSGGGGMLLLILLGGAFFAVIIVGGISFGVYRTAQKARDAEAQALAQEQRVRMDQQNFAMDAVRKHEAKALEEKKDDPFAFPQPPNIPPPPGPPAASTSGSEVVLTNVRRERGIGGREEVVVDYEYKTGSPSSMDTLVIQSRSSNWTLNMRISQPRKGTLRVTGVGLNAFSGHLDVWLEKRTFGPRGGNAPKLSNTLTLD